MPVTVHPECLAAARTELGTALAGCGRDSENGVQPLDIPAGVSCIKGACEQAKRNNPLTR